MAKASFTVTIDYTSQPRLPEAAVSVAMEDSLRAWTESLDFGRDVSERLTEFSEDRPIVEPSRASVRPIKAPDKPGGKKSGRPKPKRKPSKKKTPKRKPPKKARNRRGNPTIARLLRGA